MTHRIVSFGALLITLGIVLGAFGAHGLKDVLTPEMRIIYEKAVFYHLLNAVGVLFVGIAGHLNLISARTSFSAALLLLTGILIFCGSLYLLSITGVRMFGAITPIGGVMFILAWGIVTWGAWCRRC